MLNVTVYADIHDDEPQEFTGYDFVSLVSDETYGPPALVAPNKGAPPTARPGQKVLYLNTRFVPMWEIEREPEHA